MLVSAAVYHRSKHLSDSALEAAQEACVFCGHNVLKVQLSLQTDPEVYLYKCTLCSAGSASRLPKEEALAEFYKSYYSGHSSADGEVTFDDAARFGNHIFSMIDNKKKHKVFRILDFGGGDGNLALRIGQKLGNNCDSVEIVVVDHNPNLAETQSQSIKIKNCNSMELVQDSFDLVLASAILEHLPRPKVTLDQLLSKLAKGGYFYARTPYMLPLIKLMNKFNFKIDFTFPAHIHDLGSNFWTYYFQELNSFDYKLLRSQPSIVETTLSKNLIRTMAAWILKAPWYLLKNRYHLVGGWEVLVIRPLDEGSQNASH